MVCAAADSVLAHYGPPKDQYAETFLTDLAPNRETEFNIVNFDPKRLKYLSDDKELAFVMDVGLETGLVFVNLCCLGLGSVNLYCQPAVRGAASLR